MATQITQRDLDGTAYLRVEGEMFLDDALLVERLAGEILNDTGRKVKIDLADLSLMDSESAPVIKRLERSTGVSIEGLEIFLQTAVDSVERHQ